MRPHQPTPTPHMKGDNRRQRETRPLQSPRKRPHQPTPTPHIKGDNRRQWEGDKTTSEPKKPTTPTNTKAARSKVALRTPTVNCSGKKLIQGRDLPAIHKFFYPKDGGKKLLPNQTKITQSKIHRDHVCMGHRGQTPCPNAFWYPTTIKMASISAWENGEESSSFSEPKPFYSHDFETSKWKHHENTCVWREIFYGNAGLLQGWSNNLCPSNMSWKFLMSVQIDVGSCAMRLSMALLSGRQKLWSSHVFW